MMNVAMHFAHVKLCSVRETRLVCCNSFVFEMISFDCDILYR